MTEHVHAWSSPDALGVQTCLDRRCMRKRSVVTDSPEPRPRKGGIEALRVTVDDRLVTDAEFRDMAREALPMVALASPAAPRLTCGEGNCRKVEGHNGPHLPAAPRPEGPPRLACPDCDGQGWYVTADPDENGEPGEPYQVQCPNVIFHEAATPRPEGPPPGSEEALAATRCPCPWGPIKHRHNRDGSIDVPAPRADAEKVAAAYARLSDTGERPIHPDGDHDGNGIDTDAEGNVTVCATPGCRLYVDPADLTGGWGGKLEPAGGKPTTPDQVET